MGALRAIAITFSMFSKIPMPHVKWEDKNMRYAISFLPLVNIPIVLIIWLWIWISLQLELGSFLTAVGITVIPVLITGGIHIDGFADTVDAVSSRAPREKKREILKDPHTGAFAIIGIVLYFLIYLGLCSELNFGYTTVVYLFYCYTYSRLTGGFATLCLKSSGNKGLLDTFRSASHRGSVIVISLLAVCTIVSLFIINYILGIVMTAVCLMGLLYISAMSKNQFGGMSGDLAGYIIQITELCLIGAIVVLKGLALI